MAIDIETLRSYYKIDMVFATEHSAERCRERKILQKDIRAAVMGGEIIEQYPDDFPFPSCLILGKCLDGRLLHVVMSDEQSSARIITAYIPDSQKWNQDFKTRKIEEEQK